MWAQHRVRVQATVQVKGASVWVVGVWARHRVRVLAWVVGVWARHRVRGASLGRWRMGSAQGKGASYSTR